MPNNSFFSIGFGATMSNTDMIVWFVTDKVGETKDYWSIDHRPPTLDTVQNVKDDSAPVYDDVTNKMVFITRRPLDTGDAS